MTVVDGVAGNSEETVSYATLVGGKRFDTTIQASGEQWDLNLAADVKPKDPKDYRVVGTSVARFDLPPKFTVSSVYAHDVRVPGMLHGPVVRPPVVNSKPESVDESSCAASRHRASWCRKGNFVGVVAETEWAAVPCGARAEGHVVEPPMRFPAGSGCYLRLLAAPTTGRGARCHNTAMLTSAFTGAAKKFEATYRWPFQMHGMIGPSCAVADVQGTKATVWSGSQAPFITRNGIARLLGIRSRTSTSSTARARAATAASSPTMRRKTRR
jgi:CO/xanthine dehydrogenase Mo-binding subunit